MKSRWTENFLMGLGVTVAGYLILFAWSTIQTVYDDHHDSVGRWQDVVKEKDSLKSELTRRDSYIKTLEARACPACPAHSSKSPTPAGTPPQPRALSELQRTILLRDLKAGIGLKVRINSLGGKSDTEDFANELQNVFKGWQIERNVIGTVSSNLGISTSELEFAIPQPQDRAVQIAIHAFDHAHVQYTKNVDPYVYRGSTSAGETPALTINVR